MHCHCPVGIRCFNPDKVFRVVQENGSARWYTLGLKIGFTSDQVTSTTEGIPLPEDKLEAIFERKCKLVGRHRAVARLVAACKTISSPIIGAVNDDVPGGMVSTVRDNYTCQLTLRFSCRCSRITLSPQLMNRVILDS